MSEQENHSTDLPGDEAPAHGAAPSTPPRQPEELADALPQQTAATTPATDEMPSDPPAPAIESDPEPEREVQPLMEEPSEPPRAEPTGVRDWYILKVASNREDSIREALLRKIRIAGLEDFFGEVIVPSEKRTEFKNGKKKIVRHKLYPGYIVVHMELNDDTWYLVRDTPGIGDFTGAGGKPSPMLPHEVSRILVTQEEKPDEAAKLTIGFRAGDRVKIKEGTFENFEGDVDGIDEANGRVTVMINIFGRSTPVELEYWQLEAI